jgi:hypothetical protein
MEGQLNKGMKECGDRDRASKHDEKKRTRSTVEAGWTIMIK